MELRAALAELPSAEVSMREQSREERDETSYSIR